MAKFRKKPVVIEAVQWTGNNIEAIWAFMRPEFPSFNPLQEDALILETLEAKQHIVSRGDWVIKGIRGEFYSCKPDIFEATYEAVDENKEYIAFEFDPKIYEGLSQCTYYLEGDEGD